MRLIKLKDLNNCRKNTRDCPLVRLTAFNPNCPGFLHICKLAVSACSTIPFFMGDFFLTCASKNIVARAYFFISTRSITVSCKSEPLPFKIISIIIIRISNVGLWYIVGVGWYRVVTSRRPIRVEVSESLNGFDENTIWFCLDSMFQCVYIRNNHSISERCFFGQGKKRNRGKLRRDKDVDASLVL